ncbi:MAG: hypothetical protein V2B13_02650, partial [Pseudomonadota bacterium]
IKRAVEKEVQKRNAFRSVLFEAIYMLANGFRQPEITLFNGILNQIHPREGEPYGVEDTIEIIRLFKVTDVDGNFEKLKSAGIDLFKKAFEKLETAIPQIKPTVDEVRLDFTELNFGNPIDNDVWKDSCVRYIHRTIKRAVEGEVERRGDQGNPVKNPSQGEQENQTKLMSSDDPLSLSGQIISTDSEDNQIVPIDLTESVDLENVQNIPINPVEPESKDFSNLPTDQAYQPFHYERFENFSSSHFSAQLTREADGQEMELTLNEGGYYYFLLGKGNNIEFDAGESDYNDLQRTLQENFPSAQRVIKKIAHAEVFDRIFNWYFNEWLAKNPDLKSKINNKDQAPKKLFAIYPDKKDERKITVSVIYQNIAIPRHTLRFQCDISITIDGGQQPVVEIKKGTRPYIKLV